MKACDGNGCQYAVHCTLEWNILVHVVIRIESVAHAQHASGKSSLSKVEWQVYNVIRNAIEIQLFTMSTEETKEKKGWKKIIICVSK